MHSYTQYVYIYFHTHDRTLAAGPRAATWLMRRLAAPGMPGVAVARRTELPGLAGTEAQ